jgi:hypothetical protein
MRIMLEIIKIGEDITRAVEIARATNGGKLTYGRFWDC